MRLRARPTGDPDVPACRRHQNLAWFSAASAAATFGASRARAMLALATERRQNKSFQFSERGRAPPTAPRCVVASKPYSPAAPLHPCSFATTEYEQQQLEDNPDEIPGVSCALPGWQPPGPSPVRAVARCSSLANTGKSHRRDGLLVASWLACTHVPCMFPLVPRLPASCQHLTL